MTTSGDVVKIVKSPSLGYTLGWKASICSSKKD